MEVDYAALKASGFMPQKQRDTFSMRLRVVGGTVTADQLIAIKAIAEKFGRGYIHLTSRQGVEIPYIKLNDIERVKTALEEGGLSLGASGPRVRTVTACQGGRCCPSGCIDALKLAKKIDKRYYGRNLPHKFKFGVTGCPNNCLKAEENDFGVKGATVREFDASKCVGCGLCAKACARRKAIAIESKKAVFDDSKCCYCGKCVKACRVGALTGRQAYRVFFGGVFGNDVVKGRDILPPITDEKALFRVADAALKYFAENAQPKERLVKTLDRFGWNDFIAAVRKAYEEG